MKMKSRRCVFPYDGENRAQIMNAPMQTIESSMMIATCDRPLERISEGSLVSRGSCMGYMGHVPVYSGIDGRIVSITGRKLDFWKTVYDIKVCRENHGKILWSEIPFFKNAGGSYFLRQLGLDAGQRDYADTLYIDGVQEESFGSARYRLLLEQTAKIVMGGDILGRCYHAGTVIFRIEKTWDDIEFLLDKYIKKYRVLLSEDISFAISRVKRAYPPERSAKSRIVLPVHTALHAYNGYYEHQPALCAWLTLTDGNVSENIRVPSGTILASVMKNPARTKRMIIGGMMGGASKRPDTACAAPDTEQVSASADAAIIEKNGLECCIGCGLCERICPVRLAPFTMNERTKRKCIGCGCCSFVCPEHIPLTELIRRTPGKSKKSAEKKRSQDSGGHYIELNRQTASEIGMLTSSDAPPHIHSGHTNMKIYLSLAAAILPAAIFASAAGGRQTAVLLLISAFFTAAFHEILSGFFPSFFEYSHPVRAAADGLMIGLLIPPSVPPAGVMGLLLAAVLTEKMCGRFRLNFNVPAALTALILMLWRGDSALIFYPVYRWAFFLLTAAGFIYLWEKQLVSFWPSVFPALFLSAVLKLPVQACLFISVFLLQRWRAGGTTWRQQMGTGVFVCLCAPAAAMAVTPAAALCAAVFLSGLIPVSVYSKRHGRRRRSKAG
ncbi:MAG TPA: hypothetical protein IAB53_04580 [Candidatus Scybalocola faecipullorum]|nr:hypothetical protein [Candidatus Scybalocola faecipullorum]